MKFTSEYLKLDFKEKITPGYTLMLTLVGPLFSMLGYGVYQGIKIDSGSQSEYTSDIEKLFFIFKTIRRLEFEQVILLIFIGILISITLTFICYKMHDFKKLIVSQSKQDTPKKIFLE